MSNWNKSTGTKPDLPDGTKVEVCLDNNPTDSGIDYVESWYWGLESCIGIITEWRIAEENK